MKLDYADITILLDRSGSMGSIKNDTIGGINTFLAAQRKTPGTATFTLIQFDSHDPYEVIENHVAIEKAKDLTSETFVPRGSTPLLDAIGMSIIKTGAKLAAMTESERPEQVIFVIVTDGEENSSKEYTKDKIKEMIAEQENTYKWEFVFLAANQDAIKTGSTMGLSGAKSMSYAATGQGITSAFASLTSNTSMYRSKFVANMNVTQDQRDDAMATDPAVTVTVTKTSGVGRSI
jgi:Mg-chelatase subunit ChlD